MSRRAKRRVRVPAPAGSLRTEPRSAQVVDAELDEALDESFPASDPIAVDAVVRTPKSAKPAKR